MKFLKNLLFIILSTSFAQTIHSMEQPPIGNTPLHWAIHDGDIYAVTAILERGDNVNAKLIFCNYTPLHIASQNGLTKIAKILIKNNANINAKSSTDATPLDLASQNGHANVATILLTCKANVDATKTNRWTPLHIASQNGHTKIVNILLNYKANVNARSMNNYTSLHIASQSGHDAEIVDLLLKHHADPCATNNDGQTPDILAKRKGHIAIYKFLQGNEKFPQGKRYLSLYNKFKPNKCAICQELFIPKQLIAVIECGHSFHDKCIKKCSQASTRCPLCRQETNTEDSKLLIHYIKTKKQKNTKPVKPVEKKQKTEDD